MQPAIIFYWLALLVQAQAQTQPRKVLTIPALDCRQPKRTRYGLRSTVCNISAEVTTEQPLKPTMILLRSSTQELKGYSCRKVVTTSTSICGAYSHYKSMEPMTVLTPVKMAPDACRDILKRGLYKTEDGKVISVEPDEDIDYKYVPIGAISLSYNNAYCQGATATVQGHEHHDVVQLNTVRLSVSTVHFEYKVTERQLVDINNHVPLVTSCVTDLFCTVGTRTYYLPQGPPPCPYYPVRHVDMSTAYVPVEERADLAKVMISHEHKILLEAVRNVAIPAPCEEKGIRGSITETNIPEVYLTDDPQTMGGFENLRQELPPSAVNIEVELKTVGEYTMYSFEKVLRNKLRLLHSSMCRISEGSLTTQERSPFHDHSMIRLRGDLIQELLCTPVDVAVEVGARPTEKCYSDSIFGRVGTEYVLVEGKTKLVVDFHAGTPVNCNDTLPPVFIASDGSQIVAKPDIQIVNHVISDIDLDVRHKNEVEGIVFHNEFNYDLFYTSEEIRQYNDLIHFSRTKEHVVNQLVQRYCANQGCGSYSGPSLDVSQFDASALQTAANSLNWFAHIKDQITAVGSVCSIIVVFYLSIVTSRTMFRICRLILSDGLTARDAVYYNFNADRILRQRLINEQVTGTARYHARPNAPSEETRLYPPLVELQTLQPQQRPEATPSTSLSNTVETTTPKNKPQTRYF